MSELVLNRWSQPWLLSADGLTDLQVRLTRELRREKEGRPRADVGGLKPKKNGTTRRGALAVIPVHGVMVQRTDEFSELFGEVGTEDLGRAITAAVADDDVDAIVLHVNSPGGSVYGVPELAMKVAAAAARKRTVAFVDPLCASGAYWIASQCAEVAVTPSGQVGSIGVFQLHADQSKLLEEMGIKVTPVSVGKYKTATNPYEPLSDDGRAQIEKGISAIYEQFTKDVAKGRRVSLDRVQNGFGEGGMLDAKSAAKEGMADRVELFEDALGRVHRETSGARAHWDAEIAKRAALLERDEAERKKADTNSRLEIAKRKMQLEASESEHQTSLERIGVQSRTSDVNSIVAHHEAGHAVAAWALGLRSMTVSMVPNDTSSGRVATDFSRLDPFARAVFVLAGKEAEALSGHTATWATNTKDEADARAACPAHQLALARERARALVNTHRVAVKFVAGELLEHHSVDEKTVGMAMS